MTASVAEQSKMVTKWKPLQIIFYLIDKNNTKSMLSQSQSKIIFYFPTIIFCMFQETEDLKEPSVHAC